MKLVMQILGAIAAMGGLQQLTMGMMQLSGHTKGSRPCSGVFPADVAIGLDLLPKN